MLTTAARGSRSINIWTRLSMTSQGVSWTHFAVSSWFRTLRPSTVVQPLPSSVTPSTCCHGQLLGTGKSCFKWLDILAETLVSAKNATAKKIRLSHAFLGSLFLRHSKGSVSHVLNRMKTPKWLESNKRKQPIAHACDTTNIFSLCTCIYAIFSGFCLAGLMAWDGVVARK